MLYIEWVLIDFIKALCELYDCGLRHLNPLNFSFESGEPIGDIAPHARGFCCLGFEFFEESSEGAWHTLFLASPIAGSTNEHNRSTARLAVKPFSMRSRTEIMRTPVSFSVVFRRSNIAPASTLVAS